MQPEPVRGQGFVPVTAVDLEVVPDSPSPGRRPTAYEVDCLAIWYGAHVPELVESGQLQARRDDRGCWYFRPADWRSMSIDEQTRLVVEMLNGDPPLDEAV